MGNAVLTLVVHRDRSLGRCATGRSVALAADHAAYWLSFMLMLIMPQRCQGRRRISRFLSFHQLRRIAETE